jgi:hypothetical protein
MITDAVVIYNFLLRIMGRKVLHEHNDAAKVRFLYQDFIHKIFLDIPDFRMPDFQLKTDPAFDRKVIQENKREFIEAFFIFSLITKTGSVELKAGLFHKLIGRPVNIRLNVVKP